MRSDHRLRIHGLPAGLSGREFARAQIDPQRAERGGVFVLRRPAKHIRAPRNLDVGEAFLGQERDELCFQQSARDSTGPEIDISFRRFGHGFLNDDVADLDSSVWLQYAADLAEHFPLVGRKVDHPI